MYGLQVSGQGVVCTDGKDIGAQEACCRVVFNTRSFREGQWKDMDATFMSVYAGGRLAHARIARAKKGDEIVVQGTLRTNSIVVEGRDKPRMEPTIWATVVSITTKDQRNADFESKKPVLPKCSAISDIPGAEIPTAAAKEALPIGSVDEIPF